MFFSFGEFLDAVVMSFFLGFLFMDFFRRPVRVDLVSFSPSFRYSDFFFAVLVVAPGIILHELGHKLVAVLLGFNATFLGACSVQTFSFGLPCGLMLGAVLLKLAGSSFLFFVPGYVSISGSVAPWQDVLISFAGPFVNLVLWWLSKFLPRFFPGLFSGLSDSFLEGLVFFSRINGFLFVFNMLPVPFFDGGHVFFGLLRLFF